MRTTRLLGTLAIVLVPATLAAQTSGTARGSVAGSASTAQSAQATTAANGRISLDPPREFSAEGRAKVEALYTKARTNDVPPEPIAKRVSEGRAKGASEAQIIASASKVENNLEVSHQTLIRAGRAPASDETESGANAMERGVTSVQLEMIAKHAPSDRSLVVALDVVAQLAARGTPVTQALAQVQTKLDARAPDASITSLIGVQVGRGGK